jgi:NTE family protein
VLDVRGLENLVEKTIDWERLHQNVAAGRVDSFIVAALHVGTGTTAMFAELAPGVEFRPMRHPRRLARIERISAEHVLASAAIPALFPARRIGRSYFVDGGLRFNTPIAPAIRGGAKKLVVVTLKHESGEAPDLDAGGHGEDDYPSLVFLLGKVLNALLLDPVTYDLQVLERFNALMRVLGDTLSDDERRKVDAVLAQSRGMPYRTIDTLVFEPSEDIGVLAAEHLREHMPKWELGRFYEWLLTRAATAKRSWEADLASYLMFDGSWAERLIALGRKDALAKRAEVVDFFAR